MQKQKNNEYYNSITFDLDDDTYDLLSYTVNDFLYNYSDHQVTNKNRLKGGFNNNLKKIIIKCLRFSVFIKNTLVSRERKLNAIISNAYVNVKLHGINVVSPPWSISPRTNIVNSWALFFIIGNIQKELDRRSIKALMSKEFKLMLLEFEKEMLKLFSEYKIRALIVPNDMAFLENLSIKIAKKNNIPSFVYLHGLPARYNNIDDNRADYLVVWGNGLKREYINWGVKEDKILTMKHPVYSNFYNIVLESTLDNVLVLTKAIPGVPSNSSEIVLPKRSVLLYYLGLVKINLQKFGVTKAKLRLHPSESKEFYEKGLSDDFFVIDESPKDVAFSNSSLIIGPTSSMVLDAIKSGKNYILFDPVFEGLTLGGMPLVTPFTGDSFIKLSNTFEEIKNNIDNPLVNIDFDKLNAFFEVDENDVSRFYEITNVKPN
ncbi:MAG: hypothetical protein ACYCZ2_02780 [Lutibacter sp.]